MVFDASFMLTLLPVLDLADIKDFIVVAQTLLHSYKVLSLDNNLF